MLSALRTCILKVVQYFKNLVKYAVFERKIKMHFLILRGSAITLSRPRRTLCPPPKSQHIFNWLGVWSYSYVTFLFQNFPSERSVSPISPHVCCYGNHETFRLILKTRISVVFQVFPPERNFLWENLCFGHHNTLRSLIIANIRTVTLEAFHKIILPKYGHKNENN